MGTLAYGIAMLSAAYVYLKTSQLQRDARREKTESGGKRQLVTFEVRTGRLPEKTENGVEV